MPVNRVKRNGSYAPLSAHYYKDDAIDEAGEAAELLYVRGLAFCADVLSDGFISDRQLVRFVGVGMFDAKERADRLVEVGLWDRGDGGYLVRSWLDWNRSRAEITDFQKSDAARKRGNRKDSGQPPHIPPDGDRSESTGRPSGIQPDSDGTSDGTPDGDRAESGTLSSAGARARSTNLHSSPTSSSDAAAPQAQQKSIDEWFDEFWSSWPRKIVKQPSKAAYRAAVKRGNDPERINAVARAQVAVWRTSGKIANDIEHIPHARTWLSQSRFDDEIDNPNQTILSVVPDLPVTFDDVRASGDLEQLARLLGRTVYAQPQPPSDQTPPAQWRHDRAVELIDAHEAEIRNALERRAG